jgi:hypothetical protein
MCVMVAPESVVASLNCDMDCISGCNRRLKVIALRKREMLDGKEKFQIFENLKPTQLWSLLEILFFPRTMGDGNLIIIIVTGSLSRRL